MSRQAKHGSQVLCAKKAPRVEVTVESGVFDITVAEHVEFQISDDGSVVWFEAEKGTKLRIQPPVDEPPADAQLLAEVRRRRHATKKRSVKLGSRGSRKRTTS